MAQTLLHRSEVCASTSPDDAIPGARTSSPAVRLSPELQQEQDFDLPPSKMRFNETSLGGHSSNRVRNVLASEGTTLAYDGVGLSMPNTDVQGPLGNCAVRLSRSSLARAPSTGEGHAHRAVRISRCLATLATILFFIIGIVSRAISLIFGGEGR